MIDRAEVLHVARLARLKLTDDEVERMAGELSAILGHIDTLTQLALDDVPPTSHVVEVEQALRPDEPGPCLRATSRCPRPPPTQDGGFLVPSPQAGMSDAAILDLTAAQAAAATQSGELDPAELFEAYRGARRGRRAERLHVGRRRAPPTGRATARSAACPLAVKDLFCTEDVPSQAGSRILEGYLPPYTATVVAQLRDAGAPLLGKTNQDEFAMGSSNENSGYGPVLNPWDRTRVPGGSSGGSAAAVAAGLAPWALGTDTGGSIRQPAALCGIVGLKPTYGSVSRYGMIAFASSLDQAGPFTRDVDRRRAAAAPHGRHAIRATPPPSATRSRSSCRAPSGSTASAWACPTELAAREGIEPGVLESLRGDARRSPRELGASVEQVSLPTRAARALSAYYVLAPAEASSNLARFDGVRYGLRSRPTISSRCTRETRHDGFGDEVKRRILIGTYALSSGYYDAYYGRAQQRAHADRARLRAVFESVDFVVTPTSPGVAFELGAKTADPLAMYLNDFFTVPMSLAGIPAISIPCGLVGGPAGRLPARRARPSARTALLDAAHALEQAIGFDGSPARTGRGMTRVRARHRPRDPRPAAHADEDVLRLRAALRRAAEHAHLPGLPRACPARCR